MSSRRGVIVSDEIYHVFNRSNGSVPIFYIQNDYFRAFNLLNYYRYTSMPLRYSHYIRLNKDLKQQYFSSYIQKAKPDIKILAYALMPNHFHLLLQGNSDMSISKLITNFQHGYAKYFNLRHQRSGSLFQSMFKAVRVETDDQLVHVSRYIHLNPVTAYLIKPEELQWYSWTSFPSYLSKSESNFIETSSVLNFFPSKDSYKSFVFDQVDYQRKLDLIKHLTLE